VIRLSQVSASADHTLSHQRPNVTEQRQHSRTPVNLAVEVRVDGATGGTGTGRDLSVGGMFVATTLRVPFGAKVTIVIAPTTASPELVLPAVCRWNGSDGMGVQFGLVGARETHAITEIFRQNG
jgi:hypothetical protein